MENIVFSYEDYNDYKNDTNYFGAIIGPVAGRIQNSTFKINEKIYKLEPNEGRNLLHSGDGFHKVKWNPFQAKDKVGVILRYTKGRNNEGFPGEIKTTVTYTLNNKNELTLNYKAKSTKDTIITLTNHSYFSLTGNLKDTVHPGLFIENIYLPPKTSTSSI